MNVIYSQNSPKNLTSITVSHEAALFLLLLLQLLLLFLLLLLGNGGTEVDLLGHEPHVHPLLLPVAETLPDEVLRLRGHGRPVRKLNLSGLKQGPGKGIRN